MKLLNTVRENRLPLGMAGGAMAVCCTIHLIVLAGGVGAATSVLGAWLRHPYVIIIGLGVLTLSLAAIVITRSKSNDDPSCCSPS